MNCEPWPGDDETVKLTIRIATDTWQELLCAGMCLRKAVDDIADTAIFREANRITGEWESEQLTELEAIVRKALADEQKDIKS